MLAPIVCEEIDRETGRACGGEMVHEDNLRYPGVGGVGRGLGQELKLPVAAHGPGWRCKRCDNVVPDPA